MTHLPLAIAATFVVLAASRPAAEVGSPGCGETIGNSAPARYVAFRRLEAKNEKSGRYGWLEARTTLGDGHLAVEVLAEGGSEYIRNKVLKAALEAEQTMIGKGLPVQPLTPPDAHVCADSIRDESGLIRVPLRPPRKGGDSAVIGHVFLQPSTGDVVRIAGRLAKNPSFWISQVDVEWLYARVDKDIVMPVALSSTAKVRMFGPSTFHMTYDYLSIDGEPVTTSARAAR